MSFVFFFYLEVASGCVRLIWNCFLWRNRTGFLKKNATQICFVCRKKKVFLSHVNLHCACTCVCVCEWVWRSLSFVCSMRVGVFVLVTHTSCCLQKCGQTFDKRATEKKRKKSAEHLHIAEANCLKRRKTKGISLCTRTTMSSYFKGETHSCTAHSAIWCRVAASLDKSWVYKIWNQSQRLRQKYSIYILGISCVCVMQMSSNISRLPPIGSVLQSICMPGKFS